MRTRHLARASMLPLLLLAGPALATTIAVDLPLAPEAIERRNDDPRTVLLRFGQVFFERHIHAIFIPVVQGCIKV